MVARKWGWAFVGGRSWRGESETACFRVCLRGGELCDGPGGQGRSFLLVCIGMRWGGVPCVRWVPCRWGGGRGV